MMPEAAIALACRSAIAVSCGSVLTGERPCAWRYREIISAMSSACARVDVIATSAPRKTAFIARFPYVPDSSAPHEANIWLLLVSAETSSRGVSFCKSAGHVEDEDALATFRWASSATYGAFSRSARTLTTPRLQRQSKTTH